MWHSLKKRPSTFRRHSTNSMVSLRNKRRNAILITRHYPDLGSISGWSHRVRNLLQPIRCTSQIWAVIRHLYGISTLVSQTLFRGKTSRSVKKCRLFSQDRYGSTTADFCFSLNGVVSSFLSFVFFQPQIPISQFRVSTTLPFTCR